MRAAGRAIGISVHTGWAACVVVGGTLAKPQIAASQLIEMLGDAERFCFHMAAEMKRDAAEQWIAEARKKATSNARHALATLISDDVIGCAIVAKDGDPGDLDTILASHPRLHTAEGCLYRDALRAACSIPVHLVHPSSLDPARIGKLAPSPWGRDQKLATLAALRLLATMEKTAC